MTLHPAVLALFVASLLTGCMVLYAGWYGARILLQWEIGSGSERQLELERRTYLISTLLSVAFALQLLSLFLFVFTADRLHGMFSGAMCAAGTLNVNGFGYPVLILKIVTFLLAGLWLVVNHADTRGYDYPLIKPKYALLLVLGPLVLVEGYLQYRYFAGLHPDVITSCCGSLFSQGQKGIGGDLAALPAGPMEVAFFGGMAATDGMRDPFPSHGERRLPLFRRQLHHLRRRGRFDHLLHLPLYLRAADPSLPVLHPSEGVRLRRVCPVHRPVRRGGGGNGGGGADAVPRPRQHGTGRSGAPAPAHRGDPGPLPAVHVGRIVPDPVLSAPPGRWPHSRIIALPGVPPLQEERGVYLGMP